MVGKLCEISSFDDKVFEKILKQYRLTIYSFGKRMLNDSYIVENIVQDAFLKLWNFRQTITSDEHARRFLMQSVKWACYSYFRNSDSRFHRNMIRLNDYDNPADLFGEHPDVQTYNDHTEALNESRLNEVKEAIDKVCYGREKEVMELHFIKGLSHSQIAERYHLSIRTVTVIIEKGTVRLKTILVTVKTPVHDIQLSPAPGFVDSFNHIEGLNEEQNKIYHLRLTGRYDFEQIASFLQLPLAFVQTEYLKAWKIAACLKKKNGKPAGRANKGISGRYGLLSA
ncbi:sigma-70 family RNA polymerase sigma factor [Mucilaginibacter rigui]|uniref:Sigma-70 family RNA polymerase sigma factor n=1 Tax=Mucilaginibacter rigui TaxID=534635 RepID=A0ABR7X4A6_9SPHI|nr:sigma-70 family RNA polymerase sigma factor [Mucilaginibacter rigui]MBD1385417.1 sigma-70 family RNA polymerase sigma factor [Mucilaginibacter rigui]